MKRIPSALAIALLLGVATACTPAPSAPASSATVPATPASTSAPPSSSQPAPTPSGQPTASVASSTPADATPTEAPTSEPSVTPDAIPPLSEAQLAAGLVDVRTAIPDAVIDLRYATTNNFTGVQLYPADARCLVHDSAVAGLQTAAQQLRDAGLLLVFWDCYRPHEAQVQMFEVVPDPAWVASPKPHATSHEAARSVDVTLALAQPAECATEPIQGYCQLDVGTGFDEFTARAHADATEGLTQEQLANRSTLRQALEAGGLTIYSGEWWHFDTADSHVARPHLNVPVN